MFGKKEDLKSNCKPVEVIDCSGVMPGSMADYPRAVPSRLEPYYHEVKLVAEKSKCAMGAAEKIVRRRLLRESIRQNQSINWPAREAFLSLLDLIP